VCTRLVTLLMLEIRNLSKTFGEGATEVRAIANIGLSTKQGEFLSVVGPSGCGKSTLLQCVAGLLKPTSGQISFAQRPIDGVPEGLAVVFQDYSRSLFPWMSVIGNVEAALIAQSPGKAERRDRSLEALASVGLEGMSSLYPWQLSGGMQQRVAIARALVTHPALLVMDEPFASVDAQMRIKLEDLLLSLWTKQGATILLVTHDVDEAVYMSDRILVLSPRPTRVLKEILVGLPRPRDQIATKASARFQEVRAEILRLMLEWGASAEPVQ
jgi:NitT/TauT family transport system ATP-binding protein